MRKETEMHTLIYVSEKIIHNATSAILQIQDWNFNIRAFSRLRKARSRNNQYEERMTTETPDQFFCLFSNVHCCQTFKRDARVWGVLFYKTKSRAHCGWFFFYSAVNIQLLKHSAKVFSFKKYCVILQRRNKRIGT